MGRAAVTLSETFLNIAEFESQVFPGRAFCAVERQPATVAGIGVETASELAALSFECGGQRHERAVCSWILLTMRELTSRLLFFLVWPPFGSTGDLIERQWDSAE